MKAVTNLIFGYLEPKPGTWLDSLPDAPGITSGSTGEVRHIAVREMPLGADSYTTKARIIHESRLIITPEQRTTLREYVQRYRLAVVADPDRPEEPAWLWIITSY